MGQTGGVKGCRVVIDGGNFCAACGSRVPAAEGVAGADGDRKVDSSPVADQHNGAGADGTAVGVHIVNFASGHASDDADVGPGISLCGRVLPQKADQISCFVPSPLVGANVEELGVRFPDMTYIYDLELQEKIRIVAKKEQISLQEGVYVQASGPNFESPAEIRMFGILGADTVGMSTACEAIAANHAGMKVCGISFISNMASGISGNKLTHEEVQETADKKAPEFEQLITRLIEEIGEEE